MDAQKLNALMDRAVDDADLVSAEIPSIDLYLEQILQLVTDKENQGSTTVDRALTKNTLQYSCLGNPMDREAWWATVHRVTHI